MNEFFKQLNNDTIALVGLIIIAGMGLAYNVEGVTATSVGAIGGFIGSKILGEENKNKE